MGRYINKNNILNKTSEMISKLDRTEYNASLLFKSLEHFSNSQ